MKMASDVQHAVLLLRYHHRQPKHPYPTFESSASVARALGLTENQVVHICKKQFTKPSKK